jgi:hypothetical protein
LFPPLFPMTENSFWTSEQLSLTSIWTRTSYFNESEVKYMLIIATRPKSPTLEEGDDAIESGVRDTWWDYVGEWINRLYPLFYWQTCSHGRINWMSSVWDYLIKMLWRTVIS